MSPKVFETFTKIINDTYSEKCPQNVLELGTYHWSLLDIERFKKSRRVGVDLKIPESVRKLLAKHYLIEVNINNLPFKNDEFDCIVSCSVFEHDKYFWKSLTEVRRVLKKGGLFIVGVPIYMQLKTDIFKTTLTYKRHGLSYDADFYRFSEQAVREVFFEGFEIKYTELVRKYPNPYLVVGGIKK